MRVPGAAYLIVSAVLFTTGAIGVLIRRNVLVMFMCIELMLNAVNLTFVTLGRMMKAPPGSPVVVRSCGAFDNPGGIRSSSPSATLRAAAPPPWTPGSPVVVRSCGAFDNPGGIRSSSPSATLRAAAPPPWTPGGRPC